MRPALVAIVLVVAAALFGAVTVKMALHPPVVVTHLAIAMALLAVLVIIVVRAGGLGGLAIVERSERTLRSARAAVVLAFLALVLGALTANTPGAPVACQGFPWCRIIGEGGTPLWIHATHRVIAFLLLGHLIGVAIEVRKRGEARPIRAAAWTALGIVVLQVVVAAAMVEMHLPASLRSLHQAIGTALWISVVTLAALASGRRFQNDIETIVYESPSRGQYATPEGVST
jgi:heme A synthase